MTNVDVWYDYISERWLEDSSDEDEGMGRSALPFAIGMEVNALQCLFSDSENNPADFGQVEVNNEFQFSISVESCNTNVQPGSTQWIIKSPDTQLFGPDQDVILPGDLGYVWSEPFNYNPGSLPPNGLYTFFIQQIVNGGSLDNTEIVNYAEITVEWTGGPVLSEPVVSVTAIPTAYGSSSHTLTVPGYTGSKPADALRTNLVMDPLQINDDTLYNRVTADDENRFSLYQIPCWFDRADPQGTVKTVSWELNIGNATAGTVWTGKVFGIDVPDQPFSYTTGTDPNIVTLAFNVVKDQPANSEFYYTVATLEFFQAPQNRPIDTFSTHIPQEVVNFSGGLLERRTMYQASRFVYNPTTLGPIPEFNAYTRTVREIKDNNPTYEADYFPGGGFFSEAINSMPNVYTIVQIQFQIQGWAPLFSRIYAEKNNDLAATRIAFDLVKPQLCIEFDGDMWVWKFNPCPAVEGPLAPADYFLENNYDGLTFASGWMAIPRDATYMTYNSASGQLFINTWIARNISQPGEKLRAREVFILGGGT